MNPGKRNGGPPQAPVTEIATAAKPQDHDERSGNVRQSQVLVVSALAYPPAGRRALWLLVVHSCPFCVTRGPHVHRGPNPEGVRRAGCGRGRYRLRSTLERAAVAA